MLVFLATVYDTMRWWRQLIYLLIEPTAAQQKKKKVQSTSNHGLMPCIIIAHLIHPQRALIRKNDFENYSAVSMTVYGEEINMIF